MELCFFLKTQTVCKLCLRRLQYALSLKMKYFATFIKIVPMPAHTAAWIYGVPSSCPRDMEREPRNRASSLIWV